MINSTSNKQVKRVVNLQAKAKARREEGVYVAEGLRMCREFTPKDVEALYVTPSFESQKENREWLHSYSYEIVTEEVMHTLRRGGYKDASGCAGGGKTEEIHPGGAFKASIFRNSPSSHAP